MSKVVKAVCENPDNKYLREEHVFTTCLHVTAQAISVALLIFLGFECCLECGKSLNLFCFGIFSGYQVNVPSLATWPGFLEVEHRDLCQALALIK